MLDFIFLPRATHVHADQAALHLRVCEVSIYAVLPGVSSMGVVGGRETLGATGIAPRLLICVSLLECSIIPETSFGHETPPARTAHTVRPGARLAGCG